MIRKIVKDPNRRPLRSRHWAQVLHRSCTPGQSDFFFCCLKMPTRRLKISTRRPKRPTRRPKTVQEDSKTILRRPKIPPRRPKTRLRRSKEPPRLDFGSFLE